MIRLSLLPRLLLTSALVLVACPVRAEEKTEPPVLLNADTLTHDETAQTLTAEGNVQFSQDGRIMQADRMVYHRDTEVVTADGNVRIWQPTGEVTFADHAELSRDMRQGFVKQVSMLMTDDSRFIAVEGERTEGRYIRMNRALYTACAPCREHPEKPPLWQVRAERAIHDSERHDMIYRNATLELGGVPVFYTPYLSHPDPTVKRRSGLLAPVLGSRSNLGFVSRNYYYLDVAPDMDATLEASYSAKRGPLVGGEWRQRTEHGRVQANASLAVDDTPNDEATLPDESGQLRGHIFLNAEHEFDPNWKAGLSLNRTTDDTFLDMWNFSTEDILTSRAQVERYTERSRGVAEIVSFQDLRSNVTGAEPQMIHMAWQGQGGPQSLMGGRWSLGTETRGIARSRGTDSTRASLVAGWRREDVLPAGIVITSEATARMDGFAATNLPTNDADETRARPYAQGQVTARWPLVKTGESGQQFIEPVAQLSIAPRQSRTQDDIANEDSIGLEFDPTNLFSPNRYAGYDKLDGGQRVAYGLRGGWTGNDGASMTAALGQSHDFAENPNYPDNSGLETQNSDYVGAVSAVLPGMADVAYSARFDNGDFDPREHDLRATVGPDWLQGSVSYLYAVQPPLDTTGDGIRQELGVGALWKFADHWTVIGGHRRDLQRQDGALNTNLSLTYQDECLTFSLIGARDHVARAGLSSGDSIFFRLIFRNIGEFESPSISPDIFGGSGDSGESQ